MRSIYFLIIGSFLCGVIVASVNWSALLNYSTPTIESELNEIEENFEKIEKQLTNLENRV